MSLFKARRPDRATPVIINSQAAQSHGAAIASYYNWKTHAECSVGHSRDTPVTIAII
jgi:hypothetical protein